MRRRSTFNTTMCAFLMIFTKSQELRLNVNLKKIEMSFIRQPTH
ncbi:hypothetical protein [Vibrio phage KSF1]|uniref:Uncharacterized protein ORF XII n=1 Tax=Vibrio phage KSF1 TaxID=292443 RepID=Q64EU8_9VIRU|nr:hypothetical protein KSF-1phigpORFXII [Vibrio phage KSF1]AAU14806.1 hypothetical protein [Vibrio phage KSF1]